MTSACCLELCSMSTIATTIDDAYDEHIVERNKKTIKYFPENYIETWRCKTLKSRRWYIQYSLHNVKDAKSNILIRMQ